MGAKTLRGVGVSGGIAIGPAKVVAQPVSVDPREEPADNPEEALSSIREAIDAVAHDLLARASAVSESARGILEAEAMMVRDPGLLASIEHRVKSREGPTHAVHNAIEEYAAAFASIGGYMAERVTDLRDIGNRVIARIRRVSSPDLSALDEPSILVAQDLAPADTATLSPKLCLGIITIEGGRTSHTAILAAQLGIPAVVQVRDLDVRDGTLLALDGNSGTVFVEPTQAQIAELKRQGARRAAAIMHASGPAATADGYRVKVLANIGSAADARTAVQDQRIEGVGLFRTEFMYLDRESAPSVEEQTATYIEVLNKFGENRVIVRTLDAGSDKPLSFADVGKEANPALGRRGLRLSMLREDLLDAQLEALAAAHAVTDAELWVMAPMVATKAEADWFAEKARSYGLPKVGVMIEVPAAAMRAERVLANLDFGSLGTNDLQQYTMAADRLDGALETLLNPWEPALLDMVGRACEGASKAGKPIGVCGEAAGDPILALVLVGLGVSSLSMAAKKAPAVRTCLARHSLEHCRSLAVEACSHDTASAARAAVLDLVDPVARELA